MNPNLVKLLTYTDIAEIINRYDEINARHPIPESSGEAIGILLDELKAEIEPKNKTITLDELAKMRSMLQKV